MAPALEGLEAGFAAALGSLAEQPPRLRAAVAAAEPERAISVVAEVAEAQRPAWVNPAATKVMAAHVVVTETALPGAA